MRRPGVEPDVADVVDFLPFFVCKRAEEAFTGAVHVPRIGAFLFEGLRDALVDGMVLQDLGRAVLIFADEHRDRHAPGALPRDHPIGLAVDHAVDAVFTGLRHPLSNRDRAKRARAQGVAGLGFAVVRDFLIHRDEPLRRVAEDHRLLRAPGMRILMFQAPARQQHTGVDQGLDHGVVGVALFALVVDDAFSREAGCLIGERAVLVDGVRDRGIDAARFQRACVRGPDIEVLAAVARRGVDETGAGVVSDVFAFEQ